MRIAFFTSGGTFGARSIEALAAEHAIVAVVRPITQPSMPGRWIRRAARALGLRPEDPVDAWCRRTGTPVVPASRSHVEKVGAALAQIKPDLACIASFPWAHAPALASLPRLGTFNLHPSPLPRHRGPNPYFWTYFHDDREAGVSVHEATAHVDAGPLVAQARFPLTRGRPVADLYDETGRRGAALLAAAVADLERGAVRRTPQDERLATAAPRVRRDAPMVRYAEWDVERVWHFLAGLNPKFREPLRDGRGRPVAYRAVTGYAEAPHAEPPGALTQAGRAWRLACRGGHVHLA
jgi:methionyl-tRNA formyltransferase